MHRSSVIATVVAAGGILVAGSVASVAVINAASSSQANAQTVALVGQTATPAATSGAQPAADGAAASPSAAPLPVQTPTVSPSALPKLPKIRKPAKATAAATASRPAATVRPATPSRKPTQASAAKNDKPKKAHSTATPTPSPQTAAPVVELSSDQARDIVLNATGGGVTKSVEKDEHQGYAAWAVRVLRHDGSTVTGYVERETGVIFDWVVNEPAPTPTSGSGGGSGSGSGGSHGDDDDHGHGHGGDDD